MMESITAANNSISPGAYHARAEGQGALDSAPMGKAEPRETGEAGRQRTDSGSDKPKAEGFPKDKLVLSQEAQEIRQLQQREREVRAHEAAHAATGGAYAGSPSYSYEQGPDGRRYATGGEVSIDISPIRGNPEASLQKAQQVRAAALAPAQPSAQDMKVAQKAQALAMKARLEISEQESESSALGVSQAASATAALGPSRAMEGHQTPFHQASPGGLSEGMAGMTTLDIQA